MRRNMEHNQEQAVERQDVVYGFHRIRLHTRKRGGVVVYIVLNIEKIRTSGFRREEEKKKQRKNNKKRRQRKNNKKKKI